MQTFADTFTPRRVSQRADPAISLIGPRPESNFDTRQQAQAADQVKRFRLWNYIAIDANAEKASEAIPNVARVSRTAPRPSRQRQRFLRQFYPGILKQDLDDADPVPDNHPLVGLINHINSEDWWATFCYETLVFYQLTGAFYWWVIPNAFGLPAELWVIPTHWIRPEYSRGGELLKWIVTPNGDRRQEFDLPPDEVICGAKKSPHSKLSPLSPVDVGAEWIINSELIEKARHSTYKLGNFQNILLQMDGEIHKEPPEEEFLRRIENKFMARYAGVQNMNRPIVMPPGMEAVPFGVKPNEMILTEVSDQIRDFVLALHRVPRAIAGLAHDLNKASIQGANLIWCEHKIIPLQRMLAGFMTHKLASRFESGLVVWFDDCRPADAEQEREEVKLDWSMGAISPDERRLSRNYPALETDASQKTYLPMSLVSLDEAGAPPPEPEPATDPEADPENPDDGDDDDTATEKEKDEGETEDGEDQRVRLRHARAVRQSKRRARVLKRFQRLHERSEKQSQRALNKFWDARIAHAQAVMDKTPEDQLPHLSELLPPDVFQQEFNKSMQRHWLTQFVRGVEFERSALDLPQSQSIKFAGSDDLPDISVDYPPTMRKRMADFLKTRVQGVWSKVAKTTHKAIEAAVSKSLEAGKHIREIRQQIMETLQVSKKQATVIARTEATASLNAGQQALREEEDVPNKEWIATIDAKTRETHAAADLQIVENGKPFLVGGYAMQHPGDSSGGAPAEEIIQCRCCATGTFEELE